MNPNKMNIETVLVLNRNWQAINTRSPIEVIGQMATDAATALDIDGDSMIPTKWKDWIQLPVRDQDRSIGTIHGSIRMPTVVVLSNYAKVPLKRPRFGTQGIWERDRGTCQYTGRKLKRSEGNIDHVIPRSRGGETSWQNCVLACKRVNSKKSDKLPHEAGLNLKHEPREPRLVTATQLLRNPYQVQDWNHFLMPKDK